MTSFTRLRGPSRRGHLRGCGHFGGCRHPRAEDLRDRDGALHVQVVPRVRRQAGERVDAPAPQVCCEGEARLRWHPIVRAAIEDGDGSREDGPCGGDEARRHRLARVRPPEHEEAAQRVLPAPRRGCDLVEVLREDVAVGGRGGGSISARCLDGLALQQRQRPVLPEEVRLCGPVKAAREGAARPRLAPAAEAADDRLRRHARVPGAGEEADGPAAALRRRQLLLMEVGGGAAEGRRSREARRREEGERGDATGVAQDVGRGEVTSEAAGREV